MKRDSITGMLTRITLGEAVERDEIDTVLTVFPDMYGRLMGKRVSSRFFINHVADAGMHACDYLLACDMEMDVVPGYKYTSWETGYGDFHCVPDLTTLRWAAWLPKTALVLCDLFDQAGEPVEVSPRRMLQRQVARAREAGFTVMAGSEVEFYLFDHNFEEAKDRGYHGLQPASAYNEDYHILQGTKEEDVIGDIRRSLDRSGVPIESSKGEAGLGQQEINLQYSDIMTQADRHIIYKHAAKEIAYAHNKAVTFMAKWDEKHTGSSAHLHVSLWDAPGERNLFPSNQPAGSIAASEDFRWFLGGWMNRAREFAAYYAPYVTSYKRYKSRTWAPTRIAWGYDNRTAGFRVVGHGPSLRIECRIPGADTNPYIAYAATIAAGLDGVKNKIEPPKMFRGDIYAARDLPCVPTTLREAIDELEQSELARAAFGTEMVDHYLHFLKTEQQKFDAVVTCWERARFFERA